MELHNLKKVEGSDHSGKRVGRGLGSGMGKTSTRGQKGAGAVLVVLSTLASKVDKLLYIVVYQKEDLRTLIIKIMLLLMLKTSLRLLKFQEMETFLLKH